MSGSEHARPVWLTRAQVEAIDAAALDGQPDLYAIVAAWDAAPADPAEAVADVLDRESGDLARERHAIRDAVLRALGCNT